jgi:hypothetical protein
MKSELTKRIDEVKAGFLTLPKSRCDDGEFVIIAEKNEGGSYEEYKECLGVDSSGKLIWSYLSGCSCDGNNVNEVVTDVTAKMFRVAADENAESFYMKFKCDPSETNYSTY